MGDLGIGLWFVGGAAEVAGVALRRAGAGDGGDGAGGPEGHLGVLPLGEYVPGEEEGGRDRGAVAACGGEDPARHAEFAVPREGACAGGACQQVAGVGKVKERVVEPEFHAGLEAVDGDVGKVAPGLDPLGAALPQESIAFYAAAAGVEADEHDCARVGVVGEPEGLLWEEPVGVVGEVEGAVCGGGRGGLREVFWRDMAADE